MVSITLLNMTSQVTVHLPKLSTVLGSSTTVNREGGMVLNEKGRTGCGSII